jgi:hypothetical protein
VDGDNHSVHGAGSDARSPEGSGESDGRTEGVEVRPSVSLVMADDSRVPDPTPLTTAQLQREVAALEKLFTQRMDAIEKAVNVAHENLVRVPTEVQKAVGHLEQLTQGKLETVNERFNSVQRQLLECDARAERDARDAKERVDSALQAAKEAVAKEQEASDKAIGKSEASFTKQIDRMEELIRMSRHASDERINGIKEQLSIITGTGGGLRQGWGYLVGGIAAIVGLLGILAYVAK